MAAQDAFSGRWSAAQPHVLRYCNHYLRNAAEADEVCQQVAVRAWRAAATYRGDASFLTWVLRIAERECSRAYGQRMRRLQREAPLSNAADGEGIEHQEEYGATLGRWSGDTRGPLPLDIASVWAAVNDGQRLGHLSAAEAAVLAARLGAPTAGWAEIGGTLGLDAAQCATLHSRGLPKLRVYLCCHCAGLLGGPTQLVEAFARAQTAGTGGLDEREAEAFAAIVLRGETSYRRRGWQAALRSACGKVMAKLGADPS